MWTRRGDDPVEKEAQGDVGTATRPSGSEHDQIHRSNSTQALDPKLAGRDLEQGFRLDNQIPGRANVPTRQASRSQHSLQADAADPLGSADTPEGPMDEYTWGPSHPCFPHPNPHVPLSSPLYSSTRVIRIKRDWLIAGDLAPTFSNLYPEILDPSLPEDQFRQIIGKLNTDLVEIFSPWRWRNWLDILLGALSFWLWEDLGLTQVKRRLKALEAWLEDWNRDVGAREGVTIMPLRRTAYMTVCFLKSFPLFFFFENEALVLISSAPARHRHPRSSRRTRTLLGAEFSTGNPSPSPRPSPGIIRTGTGTGTHVGTFIATAS